MDIRKEMVQSLYDSLINNELDKNLIEKFGKIEKMCDEYFPEESKDDYIDGLCNLEYAAFFAERIWCLMLLQGKRYEKWDQ